MIEFEILYEDADIVAINKPAGVVVNAAQSAKGETVQEWFVRRLLGAPEVAAHTWRAQVPSDFDATYGAPEEIFVQRGGLAHRIDKETSGVLLLAKHPGSLVHLLKQFKDRTTQKTYLCATHGILAQKQGMIDFPIGRSPFSRHRFVVSEEGRPAQTEFRVLKEVAPQLVADRFAEAQPAIDHKQFFQQVEKLYQGFSLVECKPHTGRTHQIRVHLTHLHHPLIADELYLGRKTGRLDRMWCPRHFLHAAQLTFIHPATGKTTTIHAPLTTDLQAVADLLFGS